jgi:hypothetical protein
MAFTSEVVEQSLLACGRSCCLCHKYCGTKIETHHIKQPKNGGDDSLENCIPLCFDCHAEVGAYNPNHPKGRKFSESELKSHRKQWYERVAFGGTAFDDEKHLEVDRQVFQRIRGKLRSDTEVDFIRKHDFGAQFDFDRITPFKRYLEDSELPDAEFLNATLENLRASLNQSIEDFWNYYGTVVFYRPNNPEWGSIPPQWAHPDYKGKPNFYEARDTLHGLANKVAQAYDELIQQGRRILAVM